MPKAPTDPMMVRFTKWARDVAHDWFDDDAGAQPTDRRRSVRDDATVRRTRQVTQKDCGIAALSMMVNVPYAEARAALFAKGERCLGTDYARMRKALKAYGALENQRFRRFKRWEEIATHALVHIQWKNLPKSDPGHWVVLQKLEGDYRVLDPASLGDTLTASDVSPMRGVAYLPVALVERRSPRAKSRRRGAR